MPHLLPSTALANVKTMFGDAHHNGTMGPRPMRCVHAIAGLFLLATVAAACGSAAPQPAPQPGQRTVQPGAPGEPTRVIDPAERPAAGEPRHTDADVRFMQGMLAHHAQAIAMTDLVRGRAESEAIRLLARRIEISQESEIDLMRRWLSERGESVVPPDPAGHAGGHGAHADVPGMATEEEMARLAAASGAAFDRLFLELMIRHHEGALVMVADLLAMDRAGQEPELFQLLSHVDADQRAEIARMQNMSTQLQNDPPQ